MVVQAASASDFKAGGDLIVPAYLDGQIANGGRLGMLGEQNAMDVPFSIIGYTSKLIEDQQAKTIADVVSNDAGVQPVQGYGNYAETYRIRGLKFDGDDMTLSGLAAWCRVRWWIPPCLSGSKFLKAPTLCLTVRPAPASADDQPGA
ncbi:ferrichrome-iron receptor [Klebsiella michiganensis]|nr:ferrichrome-iron receptor [Klebsiella michiganensis]